MNNFNSLPQKHKAMEKRISWISSLPIFYSTRIFGPPPLRRTPEKPAFDSQSRGEEGLRDWWWEWEFGGRGKGKRKVVRGVLLTLDCLVEWMLFGRGADGDGIG
jgi:hypothetical protein